MEREFYDQDLTIGTGAGDATETVLTPDRAFGTVQFPAAMTGTKLLVELQNGSNGTWGAAQDAAGVQLEILFSANAVKRIPDGAFGASRMRFKSDATQTAARTFNVHVES